MSSNIVNAILGSDKDLSHYPDIHLYNDTRKEVFWILEVATKEYDKNRLTPDQIVEILVEKFGISRTPQAVGSVLGQAAKVGLVDKKAGTNEFKLMEKGRKELYLASLESPSVVYIEPGRPFSAKSILLREVLSKLKNRVWICDPYISKRLLHILHDLDKNVRIRIMTEHVHERTSFIGELSDFRKEHPDAEVRIAPPGELHDRYILSDTGMWLVGHSLKDLGLRKSFIVALGDDIRASMELAFNSRWNSSTDLA